MFTSLKVSEYKSDAVLLSVSSLMTPRFIVYGRAADHHSSFPYSANKPHTIIKGITILSLLALYHFPILPAFICSSTIRFPPTLTMDPLAAFLPGATSSPYIPALNRANSQFAPKRDKAIHRRTSLSHLYEGSSKGKAREREPESFSPDLGSSSNGRLAALTNVSTKLFNTKDRLVKDAGTSSPAFLYRSPSLAKSESSWTKGNTSLRERSTGRSTPPLSRSSTSMSRSSDPRRSSRSTSSLSIHAESEPEQILRPTAPIAQVVVPVPPLAVTACGYAHDAARAESPTLPETPPIADFLDLQSTPSRKCSLEVALFQMLGLLPDNDKDGPLATGSTDLQASSSSASESEHPVDQALVGTAPHRAVSDSSASVSSASSARSVEIKGRLQPLPKLQMPPDQPVPSPPMGILPETLTAHNCLSVPERQVLPHFPLPPTPLPPRPPRSALRVTTNIPITPLSSKRLSVQSTVSRGSSASRGSLETAGPMTPEMEESTLPTVFEHQQRWPWGESATKHHQVQEEVEGIHES